MAWSLQLNFNLCLEIWVLRWVMSWLIVSWKKQVRLVSCYSAQITIMKTFIFMFLSMFFHVWEEFKFWWKTKNFIKISIFIFHWPKSFHCWKNIFLWAHDKWIIEGLSEGWLFMKSAHFILSLTPKISPFKIKFSSFFLLFDFLWIFIVVWEFEKCFCVVKKNYSFHLKITMFCSQGFLWKLPFYTNKISVIFKGKVFSKKNLKNLLVFDVILFLLLFPDFFLKQSDDNMSNPTIWFWHFLMFYDFVFFF